MLSILWWLPVAVALAALVALWRGARRLLADAAALQGSIEQLAGVRPLFVAVRAELAAVAADANGRRVPDLGPR